MESNQPVTTNTTKSFWDWTTTVVVVFALIILGVGLYFTVENTAEEGIVPSDLVQEEIGGNGLAGGNLSANVLETIAGSSESGETIFVVSSKNDDIVREIQVHNPSKDSWILVYDGYHQVSPAPAEVYRTFLAPLKYDRVTVRTISNYYQLDEDFTVSSKDSVAVNLKI